MRTLALAPALAPFALLAACAAADGTAASAVAGTAGLERLLAAQATPETIRVQVASNGCTDRRDFAIEAAPQASGGYLVSIKRVEPDSCGSFLPEGVRLEFRRADIGVPAGAAVAFANPVEQG